MFLRAKERGLVSQCEMLHWADAEVERTLYWWRYGAGANVVGPEYWEMTQTRKGTGQ
jgi:hypothetical protein